jgi:hypothetical protein
MRCPGWHQEGVHCCLGRFRVERRAARWLPSGIWPWVEGMPMGLGCLGRSMATAIERIARMLKRGGSEIIARR